MFLQVPDDDFSDHNFYIDAAGNEFLYDDFAGKWLKKQKEKRDANPKVIARRQKRDEKRIAKGKPPRHGTSAAPSPSPSGVEAPPKIALVPPTAPAPGGNSSPGSAAENSPVSGRGTEEAPPAGTAEPGTAPSPQGGAQAAESAAAETQTGETPTSATTEKKKPFGGTWLIIAGVVVVGGLIAINLALNSKAQQ